MEGIFAYWPIGVSFVAVVVWLIRLEAGTLVIQDAAPTDTTK